VFVNVAKSKERLPGRQNSSSIGFPQCRADLYREPATHQVCSGTAALVEMAIILGSRNIDSTVPYASSESQRFKTPSQRGRLPKVPREQPVIPSATLNNS